MTTTNDTEENPTELPRVQVDLRDSGLLWLLNTTGLHPHGLAVSVDVTTGKAWLMHLADGEPVVFDEATAIEGHSKFAKTLGLLNEAVALEKKKAAAAAQTKPLED